MVLVAIRTDRRWAQTFFHYEAKRLIEKLTSWELGGRMVRKNKKKGPFGSEMGREIIEEGKRGRRGRHTARGRERGERTERGGFEGAAAPGRGGKSFQELRLRQNGARRNAARRGRGRQVSMVQRSKDPPTVFIAVCENSNCPSPQRTIPTLFGSK